MSNQLLLLRRRAMLGQSKEVTIHGIPPITISGKTRLLSVKAFGGCAQNDTPTPNNPVDIVCNNGVLKWDSVNNRVYVDGLAETITITPGGSSATAEMLLKVDNYQDEQSVLDGVVTRNVGVKVFDGTENDYAKRSDYAINYTGLTGRTYGIGVYGMCSHFVCSASNASTAPVGSLFFNTSNSYLHFFTEYGGDVTSFKSWLASQYAAGTPVIVIYSLATPTIERVAGQTLALIGGTNIIDITQASLQGLELEVEV